jgi:glutamate---cysteine ligase / carboxylate-amine ligase
MIRAFEAVGLELEYMIVDAQSLDVRPIADQVLAGQQPEWSNELVAHVIELKNPQPVADLDALAGQFHARIRAMNEALQAHSARLMPGAMHPWMDPREETRLWPHDDAGIYRTYDRIFGCSAHGWANLQSMHVNLPFTGDEEFARLHAAVRLALPILPAICASSPFRDQVAPGPLDCRLQAYRDNARAVPAMNGEIIPEPVSSRAEYERKLLAPLYRDLAPRDPEGVLRHEWANARGAIARFERSAIEIRIIDLQECPAADVALAAVVTDLVRDLYQRGATGDVGTAELARVLWECAVDGERAQITSGRYLRSLGIDAGACDARTVWRHLVRRLHDGRHRATWQPVLAHVLDKGPLARRLVDAAGSNPAREQLVALYRRLCQCLDRNELFAA